MIDFDIFNFDDNITDEQLAAYIDGNATAEETLLIENALNNDTMLSEALDIVQDGALLGSDFDWDIHKGDYGFWELGLPPTIDTFEMESQNQNYGLSFGNDNVLLGSDSYSSSNDLYGDNEKMGYDDTLMSSDLDETNW